MQKMEMGKENIRQKGEKMARFDEKCMGTSNDTFYLKDNIQQATCFCW